MPTMSPDRRLSALPSVQARVLAFLAIVIGGGSGALIGYSYAHITCHGACATPEGIGAIIGGGLAAGGVAVVAVLVLRAMGEWRRLQAEGIEGQPGDN